MYSFRREGLAFPSGSLVFFLGWVVFTCIILLHRVYVELFTKRVMRGAVYFLYFRCSVVIVYIVKYAYLY